jgi:transposase
MLKRKKVKQIELEFISIEELVPEDHLLRKIDKAIDFTFIYDKVKHLYCADNGRPPIDPVELFKMLFIGYLFGIRSERQLEQEVNLNVAYRWFLGLGLRGRVPDHSTISRNRQERFSNTGIYQEIFDEIVLQAVGYKLVEGKTLYTDSTHLKANANPNKYSKQKVSKSTRRYMKELNEAVNTDREAHGKEPLSPVELKPEEKETRVSRTDPDSGYMKRERKPEGFCYLDHRTVDGKYSIITDVHVTPGNVHDSVPYLDRLDRQRERFGFEVENVGLDAGYFTSHICKGLVDRGIYGAMPYTRPGGKKGMLKRTEFVWDEFYDCYICPRGEVLNYVTTNREGYREYKSSKEICCCCPLLNQCTQSKTKVKTLLRHVWEKYKEQTKEHRYEDRGKHIYGRRKETIERSFADAKQLHGQRYAKLRGLDNVTEQCLIAAACQNMKKIALVFARGGKSGPGRPLFGRYGSIFVLLSRYFGSLTQFNPLREFFPKSALVFS